MTQSCRLVILFALLVLLGGCSRGDGNKTQPPTDSSDWDALTWDQDEWA